MRLILAYRDARTNSITRFSWSGDERPALKILGDMLQPLGTDIWARVECVDQGVYKSIGGTPGTLLKRVRSGRLLKEMKTR